MTDKMPDKVFVREYQNISVHNNRGWGESPSLTDAAIEAQYIRADLLKWKDTRKGELPGPDDFPVLIKDDFESAFNLPAKILVNDGTRADWHSNYPFWRRILEVDA